MITRDLLNYIESKRKSKTTDLDISTELKRAGWKPQDIEFALKSDIDKNTPLPPYDNVNIFDKETHESKWDMFLNVLMFIAMYISTYSLISIIFKFIDEFFPKQYKGYNYGIKNIDEPLSALIVTFPIFVYLFVKVEKLAKENTWIKTVKTRATLVYATLTIAFISFVVSAIAIVNSLISGSLTFNFVAKILTVILFSYVIFSYFIKEVRAQKNLDK